MTLTIVARTVVGFELAIHDRMTEITRYNEDTGKPYQASVKTHEVAICEGKEVAVCESKYSGINAFHDATEIAGMKIYLIGHRPDQSRWLGIETAAVKYSAGSKVITGDIPKVVQDFATKHGLTVRHYLLLYVM